MFISYLFGKLAKIVLYIFLKRQCVLGYLEVVLKEFLWFSSTKNATKNNNELICTVVRKTVSQWGIKHRNPSMLKRNRHSSPFHRNNLMRERA